MRDLRPDESKDVIVHYTQVISAVDGTATDTWIVWVGLEKQETYHDEQAAVESGRHAARTLCRSAWLLGREGYPLRRLAGPYPQPGDYVVEYRYTRLAPGDPSVALIRVGEGDGEMVECYQGEMRHHWGTAERRAIALAREDRTAAWRWSSVTDSFELVNGEAPPQDDLPKGWAEPPS